MSSSALSKSCLCVVASLWASSFETSAIFPASHGLVSYSQLPVQLSHKSDPMQTGHRSMYCSTKSHAVLTQAQCGLVWSCSNKVRHIRKGRLVGSIYCSKTCMYLSALMMLSQMAKLPMKMALKTPPYCHRYRSYLSSPQLSQFLWTLSQLVCDLTSHSFFKFSCIVVEKNLQIIVLCFN